MMNKNLIIALIACLAFAVASPSVRFVNGLEGANIDIHTTELDTISLNYMSSSAYVASTGQIHVTNVVDSTTGNSYTNGESLLITFDFAATIAVVYDNGQAILALFNETLPTTVDTTKAWIRVIDLATSSEFVNFATVSGTFAAYVGPFVATQFQSVAASTNDLRVFDSATGSYNSPMVDIPVSMTAGNAYTVFYFTPASGASANFNFDHTFSGSTQPSSTSSSSSTSTSGAVEPSSTSTSGAVEPSSTSTTGSIQVHESSAAQIGMITILSVAACALAF